MKIESELGIQAAGVAVLHTWNQRLGHHPHVHLMVPGSGLSMDGQRWVDCRMEWCRKTKRMRPFLVDNKELGRDFRDLFLNRLSKLVEQGKIELEESGYIADLIGELRLQDWVAFIEGPPKPDSPPSQMLKYLTRYMTGGPISNSRILGERDGRIYFKARSKKKGEGQVEASLSIVEFVQQWCLHILPPEFTKARRFGARSGSKRRVYLERSRELATQQTATTQNEPIQCDQPVEPKKSRGCPQCGGGMVCTLKEERPSWQELFYGPDHPAWYEWTSRGKNSPPDDPNLADQPDLADDTEVTEDSPPDIFDEIIASRRA